ncbi:fibronectin type III domain-containing protein [Klenkia sp. PcliD-1-E]|uniref:fibronectin type III domain-containing protein n=1 Tax=Klenkia sp. PcliD-1-E TaxID=2954492 RepID=UPI0020978465|nr:fibronectin type III domain-containing protein [Klenkia sp. PcliD-1-E]MCO7218408.1 fibronectin type III domain-containing protein [Klenkia sp. PcliD-1-E]
MSTALLGVTGIASAADVLVAGQTLTSASVNSFTVGDGVCAIDWKVYGAGGGTASDNTAGKPGGVVITRDETSVGDVYEIHAGTAGGDSDGTSGGSAGQGYAYTDPTDSDNDFDVSGEAGDADDPNAPLFYSGGGGGGSVVLDDQGLFIGAAGGDGGAAEETLSGYGGGYTFSYTDNEDADGVGEQYTGSVSATGVACAAPKAPGNLQVSGSDGSAVVSFWAPPTDDGYATITGYQVKVDNGAWTAITTAYDQATDKTSGTIAIANSRDPHTVSVRATSAVGPGASVSTDDVYIFSNPAAPTGVVVVPGVSSIRVSWSAPADTSDITGYQAYAIVEGAQSSGTDNVCSPTGQALTCVIGVEAGHAYYVGVASLNETGYPGEDSVASGGMTAVIAGPATPSAVPSQDNGDITGPAGPISKLTAGQKLTLQGDGFAPLSTVQLLVYSSPVSLGTVVTDGSGRFSVEVTIPAGLANGTHHLVATGVDADGNTRNLVVQVTVSGGVVTDASLATTGFTAVPVAVGGGLVLLTGAGLLVGARRRSNA